MEAVLSNHHYVAECAVIGASDALKSQLSIGLVCLTKGVNRPHSEIIRACVQMIRDKIGPVATFKTAAVLDRLPNTRSGKIFRATMVIIANNEEFKLHATIDVPIILDEIKAVLQALWYA